MTKKKLTWTQRKRKALRSIKKGENTNEYNITYPVFTFIPEEARLKKNHIESRCWLVDEPRTAKVYIKKVTDDYVRIQYRGEIIFRTRYLNEVMLHPDAWEPLNGEVDPPKKRKKRKTKKKTVKKQPTKKTTKKKK